MVIVSAEGNAADISAHLAQGLLWRSEGFYVGAPCVQPDQWRRIVVALPLDGECNFTRCRHRKMAYGVFVELGGQGGHLNNMPLFNIGKIRRHCRYVEFDVPCVGMGVYPTIGNHEGLCAGQSLDVVGADAAAGKFIDALIAVADIPNSHAPLARLKITLCGKQLVSVAAEGSVTIEMPPCGCRQPCRRLPCYAIGHDGKCAGTAGESHGLWFLGMYCRCVTPAG